METIERRTLTVRLFYFIKIRLENLFRFIIQMFRKRSDE